MNVEIKKIYRVVLFRTYEDWEEYDFDWSELEVLFVSTNKKAAEKYLQEESLKHKEKNGCETIELKLKEYDPWELEEGAGN